MSIHLAAVNRYITLAVVAAADGGGIDAAPGVHRAAVDDDGAATLVAAADTGAGIIAAGGYRAAVNGDNAAVFKLLAADCRFIAVADRLFNYQLAGAAALAVNRQAAFVFINGNASGICQLSAVAKNDVHIALDGHSFAAGSVVFQNIPGFLARNAHFHGVVVNHRIRSCQPERVSVSVHIINRHLLKDRFYGNIGVGHDEGTVGYGDFSSQVVAYNKRIRQIALARGGGQRYAFSGSSRPFSQHGSVAGDLIGNAVRAVRNQRFLHGIRKLCRACKGFRLAGAVGIGEGEAVHDAEGIRLFIGRPPIDAHIKINAVGYLGVAKRHTLCKYSAGLDVSAQNIDVALAHAQ